MKPKGLLIAVVLLAVLGGVVWWSNKKQAGGRQEDDRHQHQDPDHSGRPVSGDPDQEAHRRGDRPRPRERQVAASPQPKPLPRRSGRRRVAWSSSLCVAERRQGHRGEGRRPQAVRPRRPRRSTSPIKRKDGKTDELLIGDDTPTGSGAYAKLANDPRVFTIATFIKSSLDKRPDDLRDKRLLTFDQDKLTRVELQAKGQAVEFGKNGQNEWQILKPRPMRADSSRGRTAWSTSCKDAKMDPRPRPRTPTRHSPRRREVATATVTDASGNQTLEVHKDKDKNVLRQELRASEGVYKIVGRRRRTRSTKASTTSGIRRSSISASATRARST